MQDGLSNLAATDPALPDREILRLEGIVKRFPGVLALDGIRLDLRAGEVHAVCGENGAGKSTLMKIISGQYLPDEGVIRYRGQPVRFESTSQAQAAGIAIIHQELNLVPHLSVAENLYLAREPKRGPFVDTRKLNADAVRCLQRIGLDVPPTTLVGTLSIAQQQMVEIAKALSFDSTVLIMDEPTSSLTESETVQLFRIIQELRAAGVAILYISHRLDEMAQIVDRVTVMRDGRHISTDDFAAVTVNDIVARMVGRSLDDAYPARQSTPTQEVLLGVRNLRRDGVFGPVSFDLRKGEILGFAGLMGVSTVLPLLGLIAIHWLPAVAPQAGQRESFWRIIGRIWRPGAAVGLQGYWAAFVGAGTKPLVLGFVTWMAVAVSSLAIQTWTHAL